MGVQQSVVTFGNYIIGCLVFNRFRIVIESLLIRSYQFGSKRTRIIIGRRFISLILELIFQIENEAELPKVSL